MLNELSFFLFLICFISYFILLYHGFRRRKPSKFKVFREIYKNWVDTRLKEESPLVAVQALRNYIMGNSTILSALFVLLGIVIGFYNLIPLNNIIFLNIDGLNLAFVQFSLILTLIIFCSLNFILSIRYTARLSILITGKPSNYSLGNINGRDITQGTLNHAQSHWMIGIRGLFYLLISFSWLINSILFMFTTIIVTIYLLKEHEIL